MFNITFPIYTLRVMLPFWNVGESGNYNFPLIVCG